MVNGNEIQRSQNTEKSDTRLFLKDRYPLLPDEVIAALDKAPLPFSTVPLSDTLLRISELPEPTQIKDGKVERKPDSIWARELPQWTLGADLHTAGNIALAILSTQLEEQLEDYGNAFTPEVEAAVRKIAVIESRLEWAMNEDTLRAKNPDVNPLSLQREFLEDHVPQAVTAYSHLIESGKMQEYARDLTRKSLAAFTRSVQETDVVFGRLDRGFFDTIFIRGPWEQAALRQEPKLGRESKIPFIGISLIATRHNPQTAKLEFAISIDQEAGALSARSTGQTSASRLPNYDGVTWTPRDMDKEDVWLQSLQNLLTDRKVTPGMRVSSFNSDAARMVQADRQGKYAKPTVLMVHLDIDKLPEGVRNSAEPLLKGKHWLAVDQMRMLMEITNNGIPTFANVFTAAGVGFVLLEEYTELRVREESWQREIAEQTEAALETLQKAQQLLETKALNDQGTQTLINVMIATITALSRTQNLINKTQLTDT